MTRIREIVRNYEFNEENPCAIRLKETLGVCHVLKGLEQASKTDVETVSKASVVLDTLYATLKALK